MSRYNRTQRTFAWVIVAVFLAGAVLVALGIIAGSLLLALFGAAAVVGAGVAGFVLPRVGLSAPVSLGQEFTGGSEEKPQETDDTPEELRYREVPEVPARRLPAGPDKERSKPQYVNLGPHEHLRTVGGEEVIEVPEKEREE